ncbi:MAG: 2Fe-2S iron-sulfur cluster-binding protein [Planctomycetota bacterium]|jgi:NADPH-dependent glutamate synthase beta subunit-like oxidoreductase
MAKLTIDDRQVEVAGGATILDAAGKLGIEIPTLCFLKGCKPSTSCMVCVVQVEGFASLVPACATVAIDGMKVRSDCQHVHEARKAALELLLSDHLGDCLGPCHTICPAQMNIPVMIRQIAAGDMSGAIATVKKDIALPAVLGRICPRPCERGCRRAAIDDAVLICLLKRYVADVDLDSGKPYSPPRGPKREKRVAIAGAGPAGLAAGYYLRQAGYDCTIFDDREKPGGMLRYGVGEDELPRDVLDKEITLVEKLGVKFRCETRIGDSLSLQELRKDFDAVFVAVGTLEPEGVESMGLKAGRNGIAVDGKTYQTNLAGVFAGGDAVHKRKLTVRAVADGKEAAVSIAQYLSGEEVTGPAKPFNTRIGKIRGQEKEAFTACGSKDSRLSPAKEGGGFTDEQARLEAGRCLHCDCRKVDNCRLRDHSDGYGARPGRYKGDRRSFVQQLQHPQVIYEPGKCIDCGLCIQIAANAGERLGLAFLGRGFDVRVAVPFDYSMSQALEHAAAKCAEACPTGALAFTG